MLNIPQSVGPVPQIVSPAELYQEGLQLRGLGQQNRQREIALPFEQQRMQQEQTQRQQGIDAFPVTRDAAKLKNEEMANELAEMFISQKAKELKRLPVEQRAEAAKELTGWLQKRQEMYPDYTHIYDPSHFKDSKWDDEELTNLERINLSPDERFKAENPTVKAPDVGSFEDYVVKNYGANPDGAQIMQAHKDWESAKKVPSTNVNVITGYEKNYDADLGKGMAKRYLDMQDEAQKAQGTITTLGGMEQMLNDDKIYTGTGSGAVLALKRAAVALGANPDEVTGTETFNALAKQAALASMGGSLGTGFSNADRDFVVEQVPSLGNTKEGNKRIIQVVRDINRRKVKIASMARAYEKKNGRLDTGFWDEVEQYAEENPVFKKESVQSFTSFDQAKSLPVGTEFMVNGKKYTKGK